MAIHIHNANEADWEERYHNVPNEDQITDLKVGETVYLWTTQRMMPDHPLVWIRTNMDLVVESLEEGNRACVKYHMFYSPRPYPDNHIFFTVPIARLSRKPRWGF